MANLSNTSTSAGNAINSTADKAKSAINSGLNNMDTSSTMDQINQYRDQAMDKASELYGQSEKYIRQNPFYFIGGAAVLGFLIGSMVSKKY